MKLPAPTKARINITCDTCHKTHDVDRTNEIPDWVISLGCNWCPACEDRAEDYYQEWYNPTNEGDAKVPDIIPVGDNQLTMPFIFDELEISKIKEYETSASN